MSYLPERMNSGIGTARAMNKNLFLGDFAGSVRERPLDRCQARLNLPAVEFSAVISDSQLDILHRHSIMACRHTSR